MQTNNLNQQPSHYRKRQCIVYRPNDFFQSFDKSQHQIISNYQKSAQDIMVKSLAILIDSIRTAAKLEIQQPSSPKKHKNINQQALISFKKNLPTFKKQFNEPIPEQDEKTNPQKQIKDMVYFQKTGQKPTKSTNKMEYCLQEKDDQVNHVQTKKHQKLINSLKRLTVNQEFRQLEQDIENMPNNSNRNQTQDTNLLQFDEQVLKNKSISELIQESNAKKKNYEAKQQFSPIQSQDSQYQITDHSSNQSSNDEGDYSERFAFDSDQAPLFGTIFSQGGNNLFGANNQQKKPNFSNFSTDSVNHPPAKLNFKPLLDSPKKSKTKKKRLFINKKKVPRWAQDLKEVAQIYGSESQRRIRSQVNQIFGICIVEDMQTNTIFNRNDVYTRSSTVKWDQDKYIV